MSLIPDSILNSRAALTATSPWRGGIHASRGQPPRVVARITVLKSRSSLNYAVRVRGASAGKETESSLEDVFDSSRRFSYKEELLQEVGGDEVEEIEDDGKGISKIKVSRQKYIPVSKSELRDAIVRAFFECQGEDAAPFLLVSSSLDSIIHAEHKEILEELRNEYPVIGMEENEKDEQEGRPESTSLDVNGSDPGNSMLGLSDLNFREILSYSSWNRANTFYEDTRRLAVASRFQRVFLQLLDNAQFEELSTRDLAMASSLNTDYILNLPIYIDWKKTSESNAIIFRRGYTTERQKGLMIAEKLDYIQSRFIQKTFLLVSKPLGKFVRWIKGSYRSMSEVEEDDDLLKRMATWLEERSSFPLSYCSSDESDDFFVEADQSLGRELPIWLAAQRAVNRYEGFLSPVGPRGRLFRKLFTRKGLVSPLSEVPSEPEMDDYVSDPFLRPILLSRISLSDLWRPATRKYCGNNLWKMLKTSFSILLSQSTLQEPAFQELILLYTKEDKQEFHFPTLHLKIYERIPIPDLPVIFPDKKLSFRILDTVRLDLATIVGLLAFFINYKFEDILSSPSAFFLDIISITALLIYVARVVLGYKRTWDRYQLLVNKTLYEKTLASGFGSVYFLLDASEQQQYKISLLTYAILLKVMKGQATCRQSLGHECERFMYNMFKVKVEMVIDKALYILLRLGLVTEFSIDPTSSGIQAVACEKAYEALKKRWNKLL